MISADYFKSKFDDELRQAGAGGRAELHLCSGAVFEIEAVQEIEKGHVVLRVYPPEDADARAARGRSGAALSPPKPGTLDRLVVSFESIACVHVAPAVRDSDRTVGF